MRPVRWGLAVMVAAAVVPAPAAHAAPAQNGELAFSSLRGGTFHVDAVRADGSGRRRLASTPRSAYENAPAYSPDGSRIAYTCGNFELCVMNADGSAQVRLTTTPWPQSFVYDQNPAFSPDGTTIAFSSTRSGTTGIWIVNADGSGLRQLSTPAGMSGQPAFSPDGTRIAFTHARARSDESTVQTMALDGSALIRLTRGADDSGPAWSPDGARIAFTRNRDLAPDDVWDMAADGTGQRRLTRTRGEESDPAYSPDGTKIAFAAGAGSGTALYVMGASGGARTRITRAGPDGEPAWQPLGASVSPPPVPDPASAPSPATADARVVGAVIRSLVSVGEDFGRADRRSRRTLLSAAARLSAVVGQFRRELRTLSPTSAKGRRVRSAGLACMRTASSLVGRLRATARGLARRDGRAARRHRRRAQSAELALALQLLATLEMTGVAGSTTTGV